MTILDKATRQILESYYPPHKSFWGTASGLSLGCGLVFKKITFPLYNIELKKFSTVAGPVMVLTHECDVSQKNKRSFNSDILICPITPFENFTAVMHKEDAGKFERNIVPDLAGHAISRMMYLPVVRPDFLPYGGIIYFNQICSTHISAFESISPECTISEIGLYKFDMLLKNHLLREKSQPLPRYTHGGNSA